MSFGFIPILITVLLCQVIPQDHAIYIGAGIGVLASFYNKFKKGVKVPHFILYLSTAVLLLFTIVTFIYCDYCPLGYLPITIETSIVVIMGILYLHKERFINHYKRKQNICSKRFFAQGAESAIVSARLLLLVAAMHFVLATVFKIISHPITELQHSIIYAVLPPITFIVTIIFNQVAIYYFNHLTRHIEYVPIVNTKGVVIGRSPALEAINYKNEFINPVIRIAASSQGKVYLSKRSQQCIVDKGKIDTPMECYMRYGETVEEAAKRLIKNSFPKIKGINPLFNVMYHFENKLTNRLIYLFIVDSDDKELFKKANFENGALWDFSQIEDKLDSNLFSECFKNEYLHLKKVIYTREKYKES